MFTTHPNFSNFTRLSWYFQLFFQKLTCWARCSCRIRIWENILRSGIMNLVVIDLMMGVQGRISTTNGISTAVHHSPLIHESGRRDEAKVEQHKNTQSPAPIAPGEWCIRFRFVCPWIGFWRTVFSREKFSTAGVFFEVLDRIFFCLILFFLILTQGYHKLQKLWEKRAHEN